MRRVLHPDTVLPNRSKELSSHRYGEKHLIREHSGLIEFPAGLPEKGRKDQSVPLVDQDSGRPDV